MKNRIVAYGCMRCNRRGFSLIEMLVGIMVGSILAVGVSSALSQMLRAQRGATERNRISSAAHIAAELVANDVANIVRHSDLYFTRFRIVDSQYGEKLERDELLLFSRSFRRVRGIPYFPEGFEFEVQYRIGDGDSQEIGPLLRRVDPAHDDNPEGGGIVGRVALGVRSFQVEAMDRTGNWWQEWDSDALGYPHAVRITVVAGVENSVRRVTARRTVAFDRVPIPVEEDISVTNTHGMSYEIVKRSVL